MTEGLRRMSIIDLTGSEVRRFRNVHLGLKSEMDKGQARSMLRDMIARETRDVAPAPVAVTLRWFYENRFLPQKEEQWKATSRPKTIRFIELRLIKNAETDWIDFQPIRHFIHR